MIAQEGTLDRIYSKLENNLEDITKLYRQLLDLLRREKEFLIKADIEKIEETNKQKEMILLRLKSLDSLRVKYASDVAEQLALDPEQPRLLEIARKIGGQRGDKLRSVHSALEILIKKIPELNKENEQYVNSALKTVNGAIENVKDTLGGGVTYRRAGFKEKGIETSGHLISREA